MNALRRVSLLRSLSLVATAALLLISPAALAERRFTFELFGGGAVNTPSTLTVSQTPYADVEVWASWETRPFEQPFYWAARASLEDRSGAWELSLYHDKLYLAEDLFEIQRFEATHGFNLVTAGRSFGLGSGFAVRGGVGAVVAHTESVVRGEVEEDAGNLGGGYELTGPVFLWGVGWRLPVSRYLFVSADVDVTAARARLPVANGTATFWNFALHGLLGLGIRFGGPLP